MKRICEAAVLLIGTLGWWGFVYPDLCLTEETCEQEYEGAKDYEENLPVNGEMAKPARKIKEINDSFDPKRSLTGKDKEKPAEISGTEAPSFCACFTLEFINTVQRVPRSIGCSANRAAFAKSSTP